MSIDSQRTCLFDLNTNYDYIDSNSIFTSPSYSPLESPLTEQIQVFQFDYLESFAEAVYCIEDIIETICCVSEMIDHVSQNSIENDEPQLKKKQIITDTSPVVNNVKKEDKKKKQQITKQKRSFFLINVNDDLDLFMKLKKKESMVALLQSNMNRSFEERNDKNLNDMYEQHFLQYKVTFFSLIRIYIDQLKTMQFANGEELTCDTANNYLSSYLNNMDKKSNDSDLNFLILINLCFMILDLLYNCSFNTVLWFINTVEYKYKNIINGKIRFDYFHNFFVKFKTSVSQF